MNSVSWANGFDMTENDTWFVPEFGYHDLHAWTWRAGGGGEGGGREGQGEKEKRDQECVPNI